MHMLITFEGIDGSGKSTQARLLVEDLEAQGHAPLFVREPGGTALSERIRTLLLDPSLQVDALAELLLFSAARAQLVTEKIEPALKAGEIVVCDRFFDSTTAYQGAGRRVADPAWLRPFHRKVTHGIIPDRTYLIEVPPAVAEARRHTANGPAASDRMEAAAEAFHRRVADGYAALAEEEPARFRRLDGEQSIQTLHAEIKADLQRLLAASTGTAHSSSGSPDA